MRESRCQLRAMRHDDQDCLLPALQLEQQRCHAVGRCAIEIAGRLVTQQQPRAAHKRSRERHPLFLAPRQFGGTMVDARCEPHLIDERRGVSVVVGIERPTSVGTSTFSRTLHCGNRQ